MDNKHHKTEKCENYYEKAKSSTFKVFVELTKDRNIGSVECVICFTICFLQILGTLFVPTGHIGWQDDLASGMVYQFSQIIRIVPTIAIQKATTLYWLIFVCCNNYNFKIIVSLQVVGLYAILIYLMILTAFKIKYSMILLKLVRYNAVYFIWILYQPIIECMTLIFNCNGKFGPDPNVICYSSTHIALISISAIVLILTILIGIAIASLCERTEYARDDLLSQ